MNTRDKRFNHHLNKLEKIVKTELEGLKDERGPLVDRRRMQLQDQKEHVSEIRVMRAGGNYKQS